MDIFAVDVGGTNTRVARFEGLERAEIKGEVVRRRNTHDYKADLEFIVDTIGRLSDGRPVEALGIGIGGGMNADRTEVASARNLPEWAEQPFAKQLAEQLHCVVYADNDGVAGALGEAYYGRVKGNFHYLIWGTGISGVRVERDQDAVTATRLDWRTYYHDWEVACGGASLEREFGRAGEALTADEWRMVTQRYGEHLRRYIEATRPEAIVFGGGLSLHHRETILAQKTAAEVPLMIAEFEENSGLVGGLGLVRRGSLSARG